MNVSNDMEAYYKSLNNVEKNYFTEELMGDRIKLSYTAAINLFHSCIRSNEDLWNAYQNFLISKEDTNFLTDKDVLVFSAADKYQRELHFIVRNCLDSSFTVKIYNVDSKNFSLNENLTDYSERGTIKNYKKEFDPPLDKLKKIEFSFKENETNTNKWNNSYLIYDKGEDYNLGFVFNNNQEYTKDEDYVDYDQVLIIFHTTDDCSYIEGNPSLDEPGYLISNFNPAHAPLLPDDLQQPCRTKNARSAI